MHHLPMGTVTLPGQSRPRMAHSHHEVVPEARSGGAGEAPGAAGRSHLRAWPRNPLHQFLAVGLQQYGLAFCLLVVHDIHRNLFSYCSIAHLEDAQNQTIICDNYSTTL
jgi:hypothetical protein